MSAEDTRPRVTLKNVTYDKECVVVLDRVGLIFQQGEGCFCLTWEKLGELREGEKGLLVGLA